MTGTVNIETLKNLGIDIAQKLIAAILVYCIGRFLIKKLEKLLSSNKTLKYANVTARTFVSSFIKVFLYVLLFITIVGILGVPMASIVAVVASGAAAIGLALQGSLSNFAGGLMILIFKPFKVHDYIETNGSKGTVKAINIFYTVITTPDFKDIHIPNGSLMNNVVTNYTAEPFRRVDIPVRTSKDENIDKVLKLLDLATTDLKFAETSKNKFIGYDGMDDESYNFIVKVWAKTDLYWDCFYEIQKNINDQIVSNKIQGPYKRISKI